MTGALETVTALEESMVQVKRTLKNLNLATLREAVEATQK